MERDAVLAFILFGLGGIFRSRRRWKSFFSALVIFAALGLIISGCGGKSGNGSNNGTTTPSGTTMVTVTATAGSLSQNGTFTLVVQ